MNVGFIRSFGKHALTIQNNKKVQFYGHYDDIVDAELKDKICLHLPVMFNIDYTRSSGDTPLGPRYYAVNITLCSTIKI